MALAVVGVSHHVAPVELRERLALDPERARSLARALGPAICLSTCERMEIYLAGGHERSAQGALEELAGVPLGSVVYRLRDEAAALHLFRVAAGLDSLVPGEGDILRQVRAAFLGAPSPGPLLDRLFRQALRVGKRARAETAIGRSPASVPAAASALAHRVLGDLEGRRVVLVGAGRMCELAARNLVSRGATIGFVANRSPGPAGALARRFGAEAVSLAELPGTLRDVDVVLAATSSPGLVLRAGDVPARRSGALLFVDIAVPRDIDPAVRGLAGCRLYDIDALEAVVAETRSTRLAEASRAELLVSEEAERFRDWQASLDVVPAMVSLRKRVESIRDAELAKLGGLSDEERRTVELATTQIINKLLHTPTVRLKEAAATADGPRYAGAVRHLFALDDDRVAGRPDVVLDRGRAHPARRPPRSEAQAGAGAAA